MKWGERGGVAALFAFAAAFIWFLFGVMDWLRLG